MVGGGPMRIFCKKKQGPVWGGGVAGPLGDFVPLGEGPRSAGRAAVAGGGM